MLSIINDGDWFNNMLTNSVKEQIKIYAWEEHPNESCGLLLESSDSLRVFPCKNMSSNKLRHFEISPFSYLNACDDGRNKVVGIYHSQNSNLPSPLDIINSLGHNIKSFIYSKDFDEFVEVKKEHLKYGEYIGIKFEMGKTDCLTLVMNFYEKEYGIKINNYFRDSNWFKNYPTIIKENYEKEGFVQFENLEELKIHDIILCKDRHLGIYLENDLFLHHRKDCFSNIEQFNEKWIKLADKFYRHKNML